MALTKPPSKGIKPPKSAKKPSKLSQPTLVPAHIKDGKLVEVVLTNYIGQGNTKAKCEKNLTTGQGVVTLTQTGSAHPSTTFHIKKAKTLSSEYWTQIDNEVINLPAWCYSFLDVTEQETALIAEETANAVALEVETDPNIGNDTPYKDAAISVETAAFAVDPSISSMLLVNEKEFHTKMQKAISLSTAKAVEQEMIEGIVEAAKKSPSPPYQTLVDESKKSPSASKPTLAPQIEDAQGNKEDVHLTSYAWETVGKAFPCAWTHKNLTTGKGSFNIENKKGDFTKTSAIKKVHFHGKDTWVWEGKGMLLEPWALNLLEVTKEEQEQIAEAQAMNKAWALADKVAQQFPKLSTHLEVKHDLSEAPVYADLHMLDNELSMEGTGKDWKVICSANNTAHYKCGDTVQLFNADGKPELGGHLLEIVDITGTQVELKFAKQEDEPEGYDPALDQAEQELADGPQYSLDPNNGTLKVQFHGLEPVPIDSLKFIGLDDTHVSVDPGDAKGATSALQWIAQDALKTITAMGSPSATFKQLFKIDQEFPNKVTAAQTPQGPSIPVKKVLMSSAPLKIDMQQAGFIAEQEVAKNSGYILLKHKEHGYLTGPMSLLTHFWELPDELILRLQKALNLKPIDFQKLYIETAGIKYNGFDLFKLHTEELYLYDPIEGAYNYYGKLKGTSLKSTEMPKEQPTKSDKYMDVVNWQKVKKQTPQDEDCKAVTHLKQLPAGKYEVSVEAKKNIVKNSVDFYVFHRIDNSSETYLQEGTKGYRPVQDGDFMVSWVPTFSLHRMVAEQMVNELGGMVVPKATQAPDIPALVQIKALEAELAAVKLHLEDMRVICKTFVELKK